MVNVNYGLERQERYVNDCLHLYYSCRDLSKVFSSA